MTAVFALQRKKLGCVKSLQNFCKICLFSLQNFAFWMQNLRFFFCKKPRGQNQALDGPLGLLLRCLLQVCPTGLSLPGCIHLLQEVSGIPGPTVSINLLDGVLAWSHHHNLSMILHLASLVWFSRE